MDIKTKREQEKEIVSFMIALYCKKRHGHKTLCPECAALEAYARQRSDACCWCFSYFHLSADYLA